MSKLYVGNLIKGSYRSLFSTGDGSTELVYVQTHSRVSRWLGKEGSIAIKDNACRCRFYRKRALDVVADTLGIAEAELYSPTARCLVVKDSHMRDTGYASQLLMQHDGKLTTQADLSYKQSLAEAGY